MDPTNLVFNKKQFTLIALFLLFIAGFVAYNQMPRAEDPGYIVRAAQITTRMPGASPQRVEQLVTDKIEKIVQEMPEIHYIKSESKPGLSVIDVNILESYKEMQPLWDKLRRKVERAEKDLPDTASKPYVNDEYGDTYGIVLALTGDGFSYAELKDIADDVRDELLQLHQIAKVDLYGIQEERVFVDYYNSKLAEINLSPDQLAGILTKRNIIQSGGVISTEKERISIEPTGDFDSVEAIRQTLIEIPNTNQIISLGDIADVYRAYIDPPTLKMLYNGQPCLGLAISMREGGNIVQLGDEVSVFIARLHKTYPAGVQFNIVAYQPERVIVKIDDFNSNLVQAVVIVTLVMLFFLGLRTGVIVATLIPTAIMISFFFMGVFGVGLDQVSLAALIISLGLLVDNSIVVSESILVQMSEGKKPIPAALDSCAELKVPLLISSLTTAAAFLPIYLAKSQTGEYTAALFKVVTITLLCSWAIALSLIPFLCVTFLVIKKQVKAEPLNTPFYRTYRSLLVFILKFRLLAIAGIVSLFLISLYGFNYIPNIFFPSADDPIFTAEIELPIGSSIQNTSRVMNEVDHFIQKELMVNETRPQGVVNWATYIGNGGPRWRLQHNPEPPNPHYSFTLINVTDRETALLNLKKLEDYLFANFPDVKAKIRPLELGTPVKNPVEYRIMGKDIDTLYSIADTVKGHLLNVPGTKNVNDDWGLMTKKVVIEVDEARAERAEVTNADVAISLESAISGVTLSEYREDDRLIPIVLRSVAAKDASLIETESFNVYSQSTGKSVPLEQVAETTLEWEPAQILRRDRFRTITVSADLKGNTTAADVNTEMVAWLNQQQWPLGYRWQMGGDTEKSSEASDAIEAELPVAFLIILFLLMLQFNHALKTLIILVTIPLAMIGVSFGLLITQAAMGFMAFLGIISLAGIVINNAIVLIDRIRIEIEENGLSPQDAIVTASQKRLRPILLTTVTTVSGLIPLWLGGGAMWESMAITIIFGLIIATLLTLGVVPLLYSLFFSVNFREYT